MIPVDKSGQHAAVRVSLTVIGCLILAVLVPLVPLALAPALTVLALLITALSIATRHYPRPDPAILVTLTLFLAWSGASLLWTIGGSKAVVAWTGFLYLWLPGWVLLSVLPTLRASTLARCVPWLLGALAVGIVLFAIELLLGQPVQHLFASASKPPVDFERDINRAALLLALMAGPAALLLWRLRRRKLAALAVVVPLLLVAVSTSQSALAALLGLLGLLAVALLSWRVASALVAAGILAGMTLCGPLAAWIKQTGLADNEGLPIGVRHRVLTWDFVAARLHDRPWIGYGLEGSRAVPGGDGFFMVPDIGPMPMLPIHPHNLFLQVRLELGWVGAALAALLLLAILRRLTRLDPAIRPMALSLFGAAIFAQCFAYGAWQGWLICGMLFAGLLVGLASCIKDPT